ncbi:zwei Ig domain protein zig-8-like [Uloborus diversus]|uniref:zwei Ig domain protein zig-8-like n=1 Tax=Uloborus diversus TaxID=327109 RepID=UPI00240913F0|nr:zwei Ig domain protein zig-8-like [Uloborus diversus]
MEVDKRNIAMGSEFMSGIFQRLLILLVYYSLSFTLTFVSYVERTRAVQPMSIQTPIESSITEDPLAALLPHYIKKSNVDPYLTRNVTTQVGQTVYLHCIVNLVGDRTVSWIRLKDFHLLTVGKYTYTSDTRFQSVFMHISNDWALQIKYPQVSDEGLYECQVSSFPSKSVYFRLWVVVPQARILEGPDMYVEVGSSINLTCVIVDSPEAPAYVFWYQDDRMINYDFKRGYITVQKGGGNTAISRLRIKDAQASDSGNYTCSPSNADAVSTIVYVVKGEKQAVVQNIEGSTSLSSFGLNVNNIVLFISILLACFLRR